MKLSPREWILGLAVIAVGMGALTWRIAETQLSTWRDIERNRASLKNKLIVAERQAARGPEVEGKLRALLHQVPEYPAGRDVSIEVLETVRGTARKAGLTLVNSEAAQETEAGDLRELQVSCTWQGSLEALVNFLFDVQSKGLLLDVRSLDIRPPRGTTGLSGNFSVACAYKRAQKGTDSPSKPPRRSP